MQLKKLKTLQTGLHKTLKIFLIQCLNKWSIILKIPNFSNGTKLAWIFTEIDGYEQFKDIYNTMHYKTIK